MPLRLDTCQTGQKLLTLTFELLADSWHVLSCTHNELAQKVKGEVITASLFRAANMHFLDRMNG